MARTEELCCIALGANLADAEATVERAANEIAGWAANGSARCSSLWRSAPLDCPAGSPDFINAVVLLPCAPFGSPRALLLRLQEMERRYGRAAGGVRNAPRVLDLDLILFGAWVVQEPDLAIPHPRAAERAFVLQPLAELAPDLLLPGHSRTVTELLAGAPSLRIERLDPRRAPD